jgi:hypothetical protein
MGSKGVVFEDDGDESPAFGIICTISLLSNLFKKHEATAFADFDIVDIFYE